MRFFEIYWPDFQASVPVQLNEQEVPSVCDAFWQSLPFRAIFAASMSAGEMFKIPYPKGLPPAPPGKIVFFPDLPAGSIISLGNLGTLLLKYGTVTEPFRGPCIGFVPPSHIPLLRDVSYRLRDAYFFTKEINIATLQRKE